MAHERPVGTLFPSTLLLVGMHANTVTSHLVTIGALVALLSIAIEPSLQALISDSGRLEDAAVSSPATIAKAERFDGGTQCVDQTSREFSLSVFLTTTDKLDSHRVWLSRKREGQPECFDNS